MTNLTRLCALAASVALAVGACADDDRPRSPTPPAPDASDDTTAPDDVAADVPPSTDASSDVTPPPDAQGQDPIDPPPEVRPPLDDVELEQPPTAPDGVPEDWLCNRDARVSACDSPWIAPAPSPTDPRDPLYHVNRTHAVPAAFPIGETSTWDACQPGDPGVEHDLVCLPAWATDGRPQSLRGPAWSSPVPEGITQTHDGLEAGYQGRVGFDAMLRAAREEAGFELFVLSSFRSFARQRALHESYVQREIGNGFSEADARIVASTYSAVPGHSEHQLGTTADLTFRMDNGSLFSGLSAAMGASRAFRWMFRNAHRFGIVVTYAAHRVEETRYVYEPWHVRFVGLEAADTMRRCQVNTEELLAARYEDPIPPPWEGFPFILFPALRLDDTLGALPGRTFAPGAPIELGWALGNAGTTNWWYPELRLVDAASGEEVDVTWLEAPSTDACTIVGDTTEVRAVLEAPETPGTYRYALVLDDGRGRDVDPVLPIVFTVDDDPDEDDAPRFVRIVDRSDRTTGADPGADIDAVVLLHGDEVLPAARVAIYEPFPGTPGANQPGAALGPPDAFYAWPDVSVCSVSGGFVSLGGAGELVVEFGRGIRPGDRVVVLEVGGCAYSASGQAIADAIDVELGPSAAGPWTPLASGEGPAIEGER